MIVATASNPRNSKRMPRPRKHTRWSQLEQWQLAEAIKAGHSNRQIAEQLGRPEGSISDKALRMGLRRPKRRSRHDAWSDAELALLVRLRAAGVAWATIAERIGRTQPACQRRAEQIGLTGPAFDRDRIDKQIRGDAVEYQRRIREAVDGYAQAAIACELAEFDGEPAVLRAIAEFEDAEARLLAFCANAEGWPKHDPVCAAARSYILTARSHYRDLEHRADPAPIARVHAELMHAWRAGMFRRAEAAS